MTPSQAKHQRGLPLTRTTDLHPVSGPALAAAITRAASKQTDLTIRLLADRSMVDDAYRAYGYFRWVDDQLDQQARPRAERLAFVERQRAIMEGCYRGERLTGLTAEESLLADLIRHDTGPHSGLQAYIRNMMAVMAFDAGRRGRLITGRELDDYTRWLAVAVTEAMHHFVGHGRAAPQGELRYQAVTGAHIVHMLRDAVEDAEAGYFNMPRELVDARGIDPHDVASPVYRDWVRASVQRARACFRAGRRYLARVESLRCRIAGFAYTYRFEVVLSAIERDGYLLRAAYPERKCSRHALGMAGWALWMALNGCRPAEPPTSTSAAERERST